MLLHPPNRSFYVPELAMFNTPASIIDNKKSNDSMYSSPSSSGYGTLSKKNSVKLQNAFGSSVMMSKEDYERDRTRWQQKLDDTATRLADAEKANAEINQIKAELNKKIVEMERNQRPLIEQNRRLTERNRILQNEIKKCEQKLSHTQEDLLALKREHEKLIKDNQSLKGRRLCPEKSEEFERCKNLVHEFSKCVYALSQSGIEKDRRYDSLVQKLKSLRKCIASQKNGRFDGNKQLTFGGFDSAAISNPLNTITRSLNALDKDIENGYQQIAYEWELQQRALSALKVGDCGFESDEQLLRDRLQSTQTSIAQQQSNIEQYQPQSENTMGLLDTISKLQNQVMELRLQVDSVEAELIEAKEMNDLLEFQLLENKENMKHEYEERQALREMKNNQTMTETSISEEDDCFFLSQMPPLIDFDEICNRKNDLISLRRSANLSINERKLVQDMFSYIEHLENRILQLNTAREEELSKCTTEKVDNVEQNSMQINVEEMQKRELELEEEKQALTDEVNVLSKEMGKLRYILQQKDDELIKRTEENTQQQSQISELEMHKNLYADENTELRSQLLKCTESLKEFEEILAMKEQERKLLEKELLKLREEYVVALDTIQQLKDDIRPAVKTDLERRFEEYRYRLTCALKKMHEQEDEISRLKSHVIELESKVQETKNDAEKELEQTREYAEKLEEQFAAQVDIIEALKQKAVQQKALTDFLSSLASNGEMSRAKIQDKLAMLRLSEQDEGNCELTDAAQKILDLLESSVDKCYKILPTALS